MKVSDVKHAHDLLRKREKLNDARKRVKAGDHIEASIYKSENKTLAYFLDDLVDARAAFLSAIEAEIAELNTRLTRIGVEEDATEAA